MSAEWTRWTARLLALAWSGGWLFFGLASGIGERLQPAGVLLHGLLPGGFFLVTTLVAWRWESIGGALLVIEGIAVLVAYPILFHRMTTETILFVLVTMALPPLVAGLLLLSPGQRQPA
jgi:hypothetical protein